MIAVTDHDHMEGAKRVQEILDSTGATDIELIWGCEVTTREGHFIGLFMKRPVKFLLHVEDAIEQIKEQGGLTVIPHPMGRLVPSLSRRKIDELLNKGYRLDAIELYNPSPANARARAQVIEANARWGLAGTGGSDAHFWQHIGAAYTLFPGTSAAALRASILAKLTNPAGWSVHRSDCRSRPTSASRSSASSSTRHANSRACTFPTTAPRTPARRRSRNRPPTSRSALAFRWTSVHSSVLRLCRARDESTTISPASVPAARGSSRWGQTTAPARRQCAAGATVPGSPGR